MKTIGERIVEEWRSSHGYTDPLVGLPDLSRRIDEALITTMATAEGEVERLKAALSSIIDEPEDYGSETETIKKIAREALAKNCGWEMDRERRLDGMTQRVRRRL